MEMNMNISSSPNSSDGPFISSCFSSTPSSSIFTAFTVTNILLLLPLSIFILSFGFQRWRKQRCVATMNPIDIFTYHIVVMEMIGICGSIVCSRGVLTDNWKMTDVGCNMFAIISCMKMFFHILTCVERYLAVVHPVTYLSLSKTAGALIRNVSIGCVWLTSSVILAVRILTRRNFNMILFFSNLGFSLIVTVFCSVSVLRVLIRPGPGEEGRNRGKVDKLKQKAFITIMAIMSVLLLRFAGNLVCLTLASLSVFSYSINCAVQISGIWFCLPSSYVLPLLFLHRAGRFLCFKYKSESG